MLLYIEFGSEFLKDNRASAETELEVREKKGDALLRDVASRQPALRSPLLSQRAPASQLQS